MAYTTFAGTPATMLLAGISLVTTAPAATTAFFPLVTLGMMVTLVPIHVFFRRRQQEKSVIDTPVKCPHDPPRYFHGHHVDSTAEYGSGRLNKSGWLRHQVGQRLHKAALSI
ncbi:MAG: hypothetical protein ACRYFV_08200 [Janthinobacterium lividum]